jgi:hypothetical protein
MNQSKALILAVEMLERVAPGKNYDTPDFYGKLRSIKAAIPPCSSSSAPWPRTAIVGGEEFFEVAQQAIEGRTLMLMESSRDGGEAPAIIVDAGTHEVVMDEVYNGFLDYREEGAIGR